MFYYGPSLSAKVSGLNSGELYSFKVRATNVVGEGAWSSIFQFLIVDEPTEPLNTQIVSYENTYVTFSWEQPLYNGGQALLGFKLYRQECSDSLAAPTLIVTLPPAQFEYTDTTMVGGR